MEKFVHFQEPEVTQPVFSHLNKKKLICDLKYTKTKFKIE